MNTVTIYKVCYDGTLVSCVVLVREGGACFSSLRMALEWGARNRNGPVVVRPNFGRNDAWRDPTNYSNRY